MEFIFLIFVFFLINNLITLFFLYNLSIFNSKYSGNRKEGGKIRYNFEVLVYNLFWERYKSIFIITKLYLVVMVAKHILSYFRSLITQLEKLLTIQTFLIDITFELLVPNWGLISSCLDAFYLPVVFFYEKYLYYWVVYNYKLAYWQFLMFGKDYINNYNRFNTIFLGFWLPTLSFYISYLYRGLFITNNIIVWYRNMQTLVWPLLISIYFGFLLIDYFQINLLRQISVWIVVGLLFFWLISGFNFFLKRYRYGKFTSAILRFWKRTNAVFWLIEGFLFSLFFYYYINSSQEPLYCYDSSSLNYTYTNSLITMYWSYFILIILIWYSYFILLQLSQYNIKQHMFNLSVITFGIVSMYLIESYQFYYVITIFFENIWSFDNETNIWSWEFENPRIRVKYQYLILALIAKYWHFLFIFISWLFFIFKSYEQKHVNYIQLGWSIQNLLILFALNIVFIVQWGKWLLRRYYDIIYYWFFSDINMFSIRLFSEESLTLLLNIL